MYVDEVIFFYFLTLQYCIGFGIYQHESATGIHMFPILNQVIFFFDCIDLTVDCILNYIIDSEKNNVKVQ